MIAPTPTGHEVHEEYESTLEDWNSFGRPPKGFYSYKLDFGAEILRQSPPTVIGSADTWEDRSDFRATIDAETTLYDGPTRGICAEFPRNVNSHATVAVAGLGFDATTSTLIADPEATDATHQIVAEGDGTRLEIGRTSAIEGVTGSYTLDSIWGTIGRIVDDAPGLVVV